MRVNDDMSLIRLLSECCDQLFRKDVNYMKILSPLSDMKKNEIQNRIVKVLMNILLR